MFADPFKRAKSNQAIAGAYFRARFARRNSGIREHPIRYQCQTVDSAEKFFLFTDGPPMSEPRGPMVEDRNRLRFDISRLMGGDWGCRARVGFARKQTRPGRR